MRGWDKEPENKRRGVCGIRGEEKAVTSQQ
jgi:hypothetical protein